MIGRKAFGVTAPIIREGDDLLQITKDICTQHLESGDILGITESIVARAQGNYVTLDEITEKIKSLNKRNLPIRVISPIYSRNRFAMILKAIAHATDDITLILPEIDEVGNKLKDHQFTGLDYEKYYKELCSNCKVTVFNTLPDIDPKTYFNIDCSLRPYTISTSLWINLKCICSDKCQYGLLGSNKASEEKLKLFPNTTKAKQLVNQIQEYYRSIGIDIEVMIYGDGCFKDPYGGIWEFADPVTSPAYTSGLTGTPHEIKIKAFADDQFANLNGKELEDAIKNAVKQSASNSMDSQGTTPRFKVDLLASLMDLISGSGDCGTPFVIVKNYNTKYSDV